jgi:hypothetical protein
MPEALPSWRDTPAKTSIVEFIAAVTDPESETFVPEVDRVAVFDNDGTLSTENPYAQLAFALDRASELGKPTTPEELQAGGIAAVLELIKLTHGAITTEEFDAAVRDWIATARHPRFGRSYASMVYQPMVELMSLLDANGFACWIFAGLGAGGVRCATAPDHRQYRIGHVSGWRCGARTAQGYGPRGARRRAAETDLDPPVGWAAPDLRRWEHRR